MSFAKPIRALLNSLQNISTSGFGNTSKISPFSSLSSAETFPKASTVLGATGDQKLQAPAHNLASSTFESSSQASGSPFGTLGPTPFGGGKSFGSGAFAGNETAGGGWRGNDSAQATTNGFSTSSTTSVSQNANVMAPSPFGGASGSSQGTSFGGNSIFGTGFGQNSGIGGAKLSSFADPKGGDMTLGKPSAIKPIGATKGSDDEGSNSEGEGEDVQAEEVEDEERDPRFQYQQSKLLMKIGKVDFANLYRGHWRGRRGIQILLESSQAIWLGGRSLERARSRGLQVQCL